MTDIPTILSQTKVIAVVGLSDNPERASYQVAAYMQAQGYQIVPVNPKIDSVLGEPSYPNLAAIPVSIDMVNIFRQSDHVPPIVEAAITIGAKYIWMQLGVIHEMAAQQANDNGLQIVMNKCLKVEHQTLNPAI